MSRPREPRGEPADGRVGAGRDLAARLSGARVVICAGSGGVGKTTTSAAIAAGLAARGSRVAVVTIDPARRLADALGLDELAPDPERVDPTRFAAAGLELRGELWAMTLDPKRTFDELVERLAPDRRSREEVLSNRIYQQLSGAVAGSQEFTAVAKLYELSSSDRFDVLVLDTPPSRNALDFLEAPDRITGFLEGRALRIAAVPTGLAARVVGRGTSVVLAALERLAGVDLMRDVGAFLRALGGLLDGFRERADGVRRLLADPATRFLIVTSPEREPVEEAIFFREKLREAGMPFGGLIVNRAGLLDDGPWPPPEPAAVVAALGGELGEDLASRIGRTYAETLALAERDAAAIERLRRATGDDEPIVVPELNGDVHDVGGLLAVHAFLFPR